MFFLVLFVVITLATHKDNHSLDVASDPVISFMDPEADVPGSVPHVAELRWLIRF